MTASHALVLTALPGSHAIGKEHTQAMRAVASVSDDGRWLATGHAWELLFTPASGTDRGGILRAARDALAGAAIDVNVVPLAGRRKRLLGADMESTIIEQELLDEMAHLVGCHCEISAITAAAMRGEIDFETSLTRRVALFKGLDARRLEPLRARVTLMPGAETLVATMRAGGATCVLITGGFTIFAERIGVELGFDAVVANALDIENGVLTGRVRAPVVDPQGKADALLRFAGARGVHETETLAAGDGANDSAMLAAAGLGVAFRAKPVLAAHADSLVGGAVVTHGDLTALLALQGYAQDEFARP